jgi:hypothetical protein
MLRINLLAFRLLSFRRRKRKYCSGSRLKMRTIQRPQEPVEPAAGARKKATLRLLEAVESDRAISLPQPLPSPLLECLSTLVVLRCHLITFPPLAILWELLI